jgi:4-diphosphocytidyl-2-C-methyl-D-erythritol kinase
VSETLRAHAKINLVLRLGPLRDDGFHRIATLFQRLELHDELELEPAAETVVEGFDDTLVTRALELLGKPSRVVIRKRIPVAGGLGGGSSDAAAVLRQFADERTVDELYSIARQLGSDVPFFLSGLEIALGSGRGDVLQPLTDFPRTYGVVLVPSPDGLSTADVYGACEPNPLFLAARGDLVRGVHTARDAEGVARLVANDLEQAAVSLRPELAGRLAELREAGALATAVSGSGPTVFGIFHDRLAAQRAAAGIDGAIATAPL